LIPKPASPNPTQFRAARAVLSLSRDQVAHGAGLSEVTVSRIERGEPPVKVHSIVKAANFYKARGIVFTATGGIEWRLPA
jgi:transcriptional regulator with XRE-family HTH domain